MPTLAILAGVEGYSTKREIPVEIQKEEGLPPEQWNTILPLNLGAVYKFEGKTRPYLGGDMVFIPGYVRGANGMAVGMRFRGGADVYFSDAVGLNFNLAMGILTGKNLDAVDDAASTSALMPQLSAGLLFAF